MTKPDDGALRVAREIHEIHYQSMKGQGLNIKHLDCEPKIDKIAALIRTLLTERERELTEALRDGYLLAILLRTFADCGNELDKEACVKMGNFLRETERILGD